MKKCLLHLSVILAAFMPNLSIAKNASWTILVYMNADNDLESDGIDDFLEMASVPSSESVNVIVQMDRSPLYAERFGNWTQTLRFKIKQGIEPVVKEAIKDLGEQNMGDPQVLRDFITWGKNTYPADHFMLVIWDHGDGWRVPKIAKIDPQLVALYKQDFLKEKNAANEFKKEVAQSKKMDLLAKLAALNLQEKVAMSKLNDATKEDRQFPDALKIDLDVNRNWQEYSTAFKTFYSSSLVSKSFSETGNFRHISHLVDSLVTIDFNKSNTKSAIEFNFENLEPITSTSELRIGNSDEHPSKAISNDDTNNDVLYNKEIQDHLSKGEVDIIGFDACLMSMLETAYILRGKASLIVGSEELEPGSGWNYRLILTDLIANPQMPPPFLCKSIVESYRNTYNYLGRTTLSAIDISLVQQLSDQLEVLSKYLITNILTQRNSVAVARDNCLKYAIDRSYLHSIDLSLFLDHLSRSSKDQQLKDMCGKVRTLIRLAVVANYFSEDRGYSDKRPSYGSFGLAIYFPARREYLDKAYNDANTEYPVQFVKDCSWDNFLHTYHSVHP